MIAALFLALAAQSASSKLPPAEPLPPPSEEQAVLAPINGLFAAIKTKDGARILALSNPEGRLTAITGNEPAKVRSWSEYAAGFKPDEGPSFEERLVGEPAVEVDHDVALVWAPYEILSDGKVVACGTDHFDLIREGGQWKLLNVTWSQRKPGDCAAP
jgi:hypothetical protein